MNEITKKSEIQTDTKRNDKEKSRKVVAENEFQLAKFHQENFLN
jgi:hypothetical protein